MAKKKKASNKKKPNYVLLSTYGAAPSYGAFADYQDGGDIKIDPPATQEEYDSYIENWKESIKARERYSRKAIKAKDEGDAEAFNYYKDMADKAYAATIRFAPQGPIAKGTEGFGTKTSDWVGPKWNREELPKDNSEFKNGGELRKLAEGGKFKSNLQAAGGGSAVAGGVGAFGGMAAEGVEMVGTTDTGRVGVGAQAASGALKGAAMGAALGPWGAAIGGVVGGGIGLVKGLSDKKNEEEAEAAAKKAEEERLAAEKAEKERADAISGHQERVATQQAAIAGSVEGQDQAGYGVDMMKNGGAVGPAFEAEKGEVMQFANGGLAQVYGDGSVTENSSDSVKINGDTHENGGVKMDSTGDARIFSDHLKSKQGKGKQTFAELADILTKEKGKLEKNTKAGDVASKNTAKYMNRQLDSKLDALYDEQETQKAAKDAKELSRLSNSIMTNDFGDAYVEEKKVGGFIKAAEKRGMAPEELVGKLMKEGGAIPKYVNGGDSYNKDEGYVESGSGYSDGSYNKDTGYTEGTYGGGSSTTTASPAIDFSGMGSGYSSAEGVAYNPDGSVNYDMSIANMQRIQNPTTQSAPSQRTGMNLGMGGIGALTALPSIGYNLYQGIWGDVDYAKADRADYADLSGQLRAQGAAAGVLKQAEQRAGKAERYNPAAELSQASQAAATMREAARRSSGGNLAAAMRGALSAQRVEGNLKTQVQGKAELANIQRRERATQRVQALKQLQSQMGMRMADTVGRQEMMNYQTDLFNIGQEYRTEQNRLAAEAAKRAHLSKAFEQFGAMGQATGQNAMAMAQLAAMDR